MSETLSSQDILEITPSAVAKMQELIDGRKKDDLAVRVVIRGKLPGGRYQTEFKFVEASDRNEEDIIQDTGPFKFYLDAEAATSLQGAQVDFDESKYSSGFNIDYPASAAIPTNVEQKRDWSDPVALAVLEILDNHINPGVSAHGGWVLLHDVKDNTAYVEMGGGCQGCSIAAMTLRDGIEKSIIDLVPEITGIVDITDHGEGEHPYYASSDSAETPFDAQPSPTPDQSSEK